MKGVILGLLKIEIDDAMRTRAKERSDAMGTLKGSITEGRSNLIGFLGEELVMRALRLDAPFDCYQWDVEWNGRRVEIKSYKCKLEPQPHFSATVFESSLHQKPDYYVFVRVFEDLSCGWVVGCISRADFMLKAKVVRAGDYDGPLQVRADCRIISFAGLIPISELGIYGWRSTSSFDRA